MLVTCPDCAGLLSSRAASCPHCGYEQPPGSEPARPATAPMAVPVAPVPIRPPEPPPPPLIPVDPGSARRAAHARWAAWAPMGWGQMLALMGSIALGVAIAVFVLMLFRKQLPG